MTLAAVAAVLGGWYVAYPYGCYATLLFFLFWGVIASSFIDLKMFERRCLKRCYLQHGSIVAKLLLSPVAVTIFFLILSFMMALSAFLAVVDLPWGVLAYLILHVVAVTLLYRWLGRLFEGVFKDGYRQLLAREWAINLTALMLIGIVFYAAYEGDVPRYILPDLDASIRAATNSIGSACGPSDTALRFHREIEAVSWWFMTKESEMVGSDLLRLGSWILFLLYNSMAVLGINRFIAQVVYMRERGLR